ncbi:MAG TPA: O-antigen ligase family protein [Atribacterota bacterium]|nr:O-antigen ligase family protein [Atribacterota bacterium]
MIKEKAINALKDGWFIKAGLLVLPFLAPLVFYPWATTFTITKNTVVEIIIFLVGGLWIIKQLEKKEDTLLKSPLNLPILIFSLTILISLFQTNSLYDSFNELALWGSYLLLYFIVISSIKDKKWISIILTTIFLAASIAAVYCIFQFYGLDFSFWRKIGGRGSLFSTFGNPNYLAGYLAAVIPLVFVLFCLQKVKFKKIILELIIALLYASLLMTLCRGAWMGLFISVVVMLGAIYFFKRSELTFFRKNKNWIVSLILILLVISIVYSTPNPLNPEKISVTQRVAATIEEGSSSMQCRFLIWLSSLETIRQSPILGKGIGTYGINFPLSQGIVLEKERYKKYIPYTNKSINAHNDYLHIGGEIGIIGLGAFLWVIFAFYKNILNGLLRSQNRERIFLLIGFIGGVTALLAHALFSFPFHIISNGMLFWLILGLSVVIVKGSEKVKESNDEEFLDDKGDKKNNLEKYNIFRIFKENILLRRFIQIGIVVIVILVVMIKINWYRADIYLKKGEMLMQTKNYLVAVEELEKSRKLNPYNGKNYLPLGVTYNNLGRYDEAVMAFKEAEKNWITQELYNGLGYAYLKLGDLEKTEEAYQKNIYMFPNITDAYLNLANVYVLQAEKDLSEGKINLAEKKLDKAFLIYEQGMVFDKEFLLPARLIKGYQGVAVEKVALNSEEINSSGLLVREERSANGEMVMGNPYNSRYFYNPQDFSILDILSPWAPPGKPLYFKSFFYGEDNIKKNLSAFLEVEDGEGNSIASLEMNKNEENIFFKPTEDGTMHCAPTIWGGLLKEGLPEGEYKVILKLKDGEREIAETEKRFRIYEEQEISGRIIEFFVPQAKVGEAIIPKIIFKNQSIEILPVWGFFKVINNKGQEIANVIIDKVDVSVSGDGELEVSWQPEKRLTVGLYKAEVIAIFGKDQADHRESLFLVTK